MCIHHKFTSHQIGGNLVKIVVRTERILSIYEYRVRLQVDYAYYVYSTTCSVRVLITKPRWDDGICPRIRYLHDLQLA